MKRILLGFEVTDEETGVVDRTLITVDPRFADSLPHVLQAFTAFLQAQTFVVDTVAAIGPTGHVHTSDDV